MMDREKRIDLIMHVFVQWLAHIGLLDEWLTATVERVERYDYDDNATFENNMAGKVRNIRSHHRTAISRSFTWSLARDSVEWVMVGRQWERLAMSVEIAIERAEDGQ